MLQHTLKPRAYEQEKRKHDSMNKLTHKEINMSKRQVNIFLPLHIPECSYRQAYVMEVLKLLQQWCGHKWLSIIPPC